MVSSIPRGSNGASGAQGRVRAAVRQHGHRKGQAPAESGGALQPWQTEEEKDQGETYPFFLDVPLVHRVVRRLQPVEALLFPLVLMMPL